MTILNTGSITSTALDAIYGDTQAGSLTIINRNQIATNGGGGVGLGGQTISGAVRIINSGTITAGNSGLGIGARTANGTIFIQNDGTIDAAATGVSGIIAYTLGRDGAGAIPITIVNTGTVQVAGPDGGQTTGAGVSASSTGLSSITNSGSITVSSSAAAVEFTVPGTVTAATGASLVNQAGGAISNASGIAVFSGDQNTTIVNSGSIGTGVTGGDAIKLGAGANTLSLTPGSSITGFVRNGDTVTSGEAPTFTVGVNSLILGGTGQASFDASQIGPTPTQSGLTFDATTGTFSGAAPATDTQHQYQGFSLFQKTGGGTWTLTGAGTALTPWQVSGGALAISSDANLGAPAGSLTLDGGALEATASLATTRAIALGQSGGGVAVDAGSTLTAGGVVSGIGPLTKTGGGTLALTAANTYSGGTVLAAGTLAVGDAMALGAGALTFGGGALQAGADGLTIGNGALLAQNGTIDTQGYGLTYAGVISGGGALTKLGSGTLALTAANSFSGGTLLDAGAVSVGNAGALGSGAVTFNGGACRLARTGSCSAMRPCWRARARSTREPSA